jgi:putative intracellular protease/amidase
MPKILEADVRDILLVLSAGSAGVCAEEFVILHRGFLAAGHRVVLATPAGLPARFDPSSLNAEAAEMDIADITEHLRAHAEVLASPLATGALASDAFDVIAIPGGYGPPEDLHEDSDLRRIIEQADARGAFIVAVCHGQAALLSAHDAEGHWLFAGRKMTAFSDEEELEFGVVRPGPRLIASRLRERGAIYQRGPKWNPFVVRDRNLFTGQNPASTFALVSAVLAALSESRPDEDPHTGSTGAYSKVSSS